MIVFPAVDIRHGRCVRLQQGCPDTETTYCEEPSDAALRWALAGAKTMHVVDLDAAIEGVPRNRNALLRILQRVTLPVQVAGGLRGQDDVQETLAAGAARAVLGTRAATEPEWAARLCRRFPDRIVIALDARKGEIAIRGWKESSGRPVIEMARELEAARPAAFLYTDITRDGMMSSPHIEGVEALLEAVSVPVMASGGVASLEDIRRLGQCGADGVIVGKALYEGKFELAEALEVASCYPSRLACAPVSWRPQRGSMS